MHLCKYMIKKVVMLLSTVDTLKQLNYDLENNSNYIILRQYKYNMSTKDLLNKYATTDDQKQTFKSTSF